MSSSVCVCVRYVLGLPCAYTLFLWRNREKVRQDQCLRERGEGDSALTNPHIQVLCRVNAFRRSLRLTCALMWMGFMGRWLLLMVGVDEPMSWVEQVE